MVQKKKYTVADVKSGAEFEIELLDEEEKPMANTRYEVIFEKGLLLSGTTDSKGIGRNNEKIPDEDFDIILPSEEEAD
jgi:hypothetical protein